VVEDGEDNSSRVGRKGGVGKPFVFSLGLEQEELLKEYRLESGISTKSENIRHLVSMGLMMWKSGGDFRTRLERLEDAVQTAGWM